ncbi:hypothetical protein EG329_012192 [Mollisiaceae sp. DMI_Dod_QoI]|nr:hypothetical protein EG329_012192 [Helotiales sp. DMI_Dod_QoI]
MDWQLEVELGGTDDINFDRHFHGLTQLYAVEGQTIRADVIAITGLDGHAFGSWRGKGPLGRTWLQDFLRKDLPQCRTMIYGYNSKLQIRGINTILDYSAGFIEELKKVRCSPEEVRRPLILIGHSFRGLIVAHTLVKAKQADQDINPTVAALYNAISLMMFFGTPHRGLMIDDIQTMVCEDSSNPRVAVVEEIRHGSQRLEDQLHDFKNLIRHRRIISFIEMQQTRRLVKDTSKNPPWSRYGDFMTVLSFAESQDREFNIDIASNSTCEWLFETSDYRKWADWTLPQTASHRRLLWLKGKPGAGKSTLMKEALRRAKSSGIADSVAVSGFFFATRGNVKLQKTPLGLFRTILHDLLQQDKALLSAFVPVFLRKRAALSGSWQWHQEELQDFLKSAYLEDTYGVKRTQLFVDALDECEEGDYDIARDLVYYFRDLAAGKKLRICLSSRHYPQIKIPDCPQITVELNNRPDIVRYVETKLSPSGFDNKAARFASKVASKANGVFLWVVLVVKRLNVDLENELTEQELEETLRTVPQTLEDLFESLFADLRSGAERSKSVAIIQWILLAARPLRMLELRHALMLCGESPITNISVDETSRDLLPTEPDRFLTSIRAYTRGLGEITYGPILRSQQWRRRMRSPETFPALHSTQLGLELGNGIICAPSAANTSPTAKSAYTENIVFKGRGRPEFKILGNNKRRSTDTPAVEFAPAVHVARRPKAVNEYSRRYEFPMSSYFCMDYIIIAELKGIESRDAKVQDRRLLSVQYPFLEYAARFLFCHVQKAEAGKQTMTRLLDQLQDPKGRLWSRWTFLQEQFYIDPAVSYNRTLPVHALYERKLFTSAKILMGKGIDIDSRDKNGATSLHYAVRLKSADVVRFLVGHGANVCAKNSEGNTPLHEAADLPQDTPLEELVAPLLLQRESLEPQNEVGDSPLHFAVRRGQEKLVKLMIARNIDLNVHNKLGDTPLHIAAAITHESIFRYLVEAGSTVDTKNFLCQTALHVVASIRNPAVMLYLLHVGADINVGDGHSMTALHIRALAGMGLKLLIGRGAAVDARTFNRQTALHLTVAQGSWDSSVTLIEAGANVNAKDWAGNIPLHYAASIADSRLLNYLLKLQPEVSAKNRWGFTPFHYAAQAEDFLRFEMLVNAGSDLAALSNSQRTAMDLAGSKLSGDKRFSNLIESKGWRRTLRFVNGRIMRVFETV